MKNTKDTKPLSVARGFALIAIPGFVAATAALTLVGVGTMSRDTAPSATVKMAVISKKAPIIKIPSAPSKSDIEKQLDSIQINIPTFDLSASPIPNVKLDSLNLLLPQLPSKGLMQNFSANSDFGFSGEITIPIPNVQITIPSGSGSSNIPTGIPTGVPTAIPTIPTPSVPTPVPSTPSTPSQAPTNSEICSQFASVPSCSYLEGSDRTMCEQCEAAGL